MLILQNLFQNENVMLWKPGYNNPTLTQWTIGQIGYFLMIFLIILSLMFLLRILKNTGSLEKINNFLEIGVGSGCIVLSILNEINCLKTNSYSI